MTKHKFTVETEAFEVDQLKTYIDGPLWKYAMQDLDNAFRLKSKHAELQETSWDEVRQILHDILEDKGLSLYD